jgi:hypothetical protein
VPADTLPPVFGASVATNVGTRIVVTARVYDRKTPVQDSDFAFVNGAYQPPSLRVKHGKRKSFIKNFQPQMKWVGGTLWRAEFDLDDGPSALQTIKQMKTLVFEVCATDRAGNAACSDESPVWDLDL